MTPWKTSESFHCFWTPSLASFGLLCIQLDQTLYAVCRGFSWEKNYPGDEGISGMYLGS